MRKLLTVFLAVAVLCGGIAMATAQGTHTPDQAKAFVEKAAAFVKSEGKDNAIAAFSDPKGQWVDGDLYIVVMDANDGKLTLLSLSVNKAMVGKPQIDVKDAEGKAFNQEMLAAVSKSNDAWISYMWPNPATKKIAAKKTFFSKVGDVIIGAGVYE
jgi:cytochrome c